MVVLPHLTRSRHRALCNNARAFRERSNAYRSIGKLDRALAYERKAERPDPRDAKASDNLGDAFVGKVQYQCAIHDYEELVAIRTDPRGGASGDSFQGCKTRCARKKATTCRSNSTWKTARSKPSASAQI